VPPLFYNRISNANKTDLARAILLLGSNLGDRQLLLQTAIQQIEKEAGKVLTVSSIYETAPWGTKSQNGYLNQAVCIDTKSCPFELLTILQKIEIDLGRTRNIRWEDRVIDIDIILFENEIINTPTLTIPHPELQNRRFALVPVCEIASDWIHPILHSDMRTILTKCKDEGNIQPL
jgi:2-amino-4-hydroxy-6-hydroxymethyldihydropteridine diphosphokinase